MNDFFDNILENDLQIEEKEHIKRFVPNWEFVIKTTADKCNFVCYIISKRFDSMVFKNKSEIQYNIKSMEKYKSDEVILITIDVSGEFNSVYDANDFLELLYIDDETHVMMTAIGYTVCANFDVLFLNDQNRSIYTIINERITLLKCLYKHGIYGNFDSYTTYLILKKNLHLINGNICSFINTIGLQISQNKKCETVPECNFKHRDSFRKLKDFLYSIHEFDVAVKLYASHCPIDDYFYRHGDIREENWFLTDDGKPYSGITIHSDYQTGMYYSIYEPFCGFVMEMVNNLHQISTGMNTMHHGFMLKTGCLENTSLIMFTGLVYSDAPIMTAMAIRGCAANVQKALNFIRGYE